MTEAEKLATIQQRKEMGLITQIEAIALDREIDADEAEEIYQKIQAEQGAEIERIMPTRQPETVDVEDDAEDEDEYLNG
jgi:hypothetical protein